MQQEEEFFKERGDTNIFKQVIYKYLPFWPLFLVTVSISMVIAFIDLRSQIPVYVASARVLLKDPNKDGGDSKVLDALNIFSEKKIVDNEIVALRSSDMMAEVVKRLDLYARVLNKGNVRTEELYKDNSPLKFIAIDKDNFNLWGTYFFSVDWKKKLVTIDNKKVPFDHVTTINGTPVKLEMNYNYNPNLQGKNYFVQFASPGGAAGGLVGGLRISPYSYSSTILNVSMEIPVPEKGRDVLKKLFEIYNVDAIADKNMIADKTMDFIDDRLGLVTLQLDSVERNIAQFQARESVVELGTQASNYYGKVTELDQQNSQLDLQLEALDDIRSYVSGKGNTTGTVPSLVLLSDPSLSALINKLYAAESEANHIVAVTGERNDAAVMATAEVSRLKSDIMENMSNIKKNLLVQKNQVNSKIAQNSYLLTQIPEKQRAFIDISRQQSIKNAIYTYLLQKREETAISSAASTADLKVIESPTSYGPIRPVAKNFYLSGLIIGLLAAAFIVLLKEVFSRKVLFRSEIEDKVKIPILGELVQVPSKDRIVIMDGKRTVIAEQFRAIRTNLAFMGLSEQKNTLMVTSSVPSEGKSFVAINLAISFTLTGKRVALLEMDLRKPKLSRILGVKRNPGISTYLVGKAAVDEIAKQTSIPGLFVVSAGPIPPNPTELIQGEKFRELITELKEKFDYVIMDTAPVSPVTDAQLLQEFANINLFVVRHAVTPRVFLSMIEGLHQQKKFKHM
jgi:capsular exopolysaccharide synthesis family protein